MPNLEILKRERYAISDIRPATGFSSAARINNWISRGLISLEAEAPGVGRAREFTLLDAWRIAVLTALQSVGVSIRHAWAVASEITYDSDYEARPKSSQEHIVLAVAPRTFNKGSRHGEAAITRHLASNTIAEMRDELYEICFSVLDLTGLLRGVDEILAQRLFYRGVFTHRELGIESHMGFDFESLPESPRARRLREREAAAENPTVPAGRDDDGVL